MQPAERFLRTIAQADLDGVGCYVVAWADIATALPGLYREGTLAYTSSIADRVLQPWLESQNRWTGPGFATVVFRERIASWVDVLGCCVHELSHWLSDDRPADTRPADELERELADWAAATYERPNPPWQDHESPFIRAAAHLSNRAGIVLEAIRPRTVRFSTAYTGYSENTWMRTLETELDYSGSIRELLRTDPPADFMDLWNFVTEGY